MMAEIMGKYTGNCKGKGGSMHIADFPKGMLGANAIVGASIPLAVGAALTAKYQGKEKDSIGVAFFGDGASSQGVLHESMNLASIWKLPVIFACENNQYAEATPSWYAVSVEDIADRAASYNIPGVIVDGMDVFQVYEAAEEAVARARKGLGPTLLELKLTDTMVIFMQIKLKNIEQRMKKMNGKIETVLKHLRKKLLSKN